MTAALRLTRTELRLFLREPAAAVLTLAFPLVLLVLLLEIFGSDTSPDFRGGTGASHYVPGYIAAVAMSVGLLTVPVHLAGYGERGVLRRFRAAGVAPGTVVVAEGVLAVALAAAGTVVMTLLGVIAYDLSLPLDPAAFVLSLTVGVAGAVGSGLLVLAVAPTAGATQAGGMLLFFGMFFISGAGPPRALLPDWLDGLAAALPMTWLVGALQDPWLGHGIDVRALTLLGLVGVAGVAAGRQRLLQQI